MKKNVERASEGTVSGQTGGLEQVMTLGELVERSASKFSDNVAFQMRKNGGYRKYSFRQAKDVILKLQGKLAGMGVSKGDRVAVISENRPEWALSFLAITGMGAIAVPLDAMLRKEDVLPLLKDSEPKVIILSQKYMEYTVGTRVEGRAVVMEEFGGLLPATFNPPPGDLDEIASIVYTSGTTGTPKGVMLSHRNIVSNAIAVFSLFDLGPGDNFLSVLPLHHTFETTGGFLAPFYGGCTITYAESLKSHNILRNMQETGVTVMCGVPLLYQLFYEGIIREVEEKKLKKIFNFLFLISKFIFFTVRLNAGKIFFSTVHKKFGGKIRFFVTGGAPIEKATLEKFRLMGFPVLQAYGLTESAPALTVNTLKGNRLGSVGKPLPGVKIRIAGDAAIGEILAFGPNVMKGFYKRKDLTDEVISENGWLHTGDVGYLDRDGFLFITGRLKDVIVTASGVNVYPEEIEDSLKKIPIISESCVLGSKISEGIRKGAEEVIAVVVPKEGFGEKEVKAAIEKLNNRLTEYKRISRVIIRRKELPKTRLFKIKKYLVRKEMGL